MSERAHVSGSGLAEALSGIGRYERQAEQLDAQLAAVMADAQRACSDDVRAAERALDLARARESSSREGQGNRSARGSDAAADDLRRARLRLEIVLRANQNAKRALARHRAGRQQAFDRGRAVTGRAAERVGEYLNAPGALGRLAVGGATGAVPSPATIGALGGAALSGSVEVDDGDER